MRSLLFFVLVSSVVACSKSDPPKDDPTAKNATSAATPTISSSGAPSSAGAPASASATPAASAGGTALAADANGALAISWKVANAPGSKATVSLVAGDQTIALGALDAASDDEGGGIATCAMRNTGTTSSKLQCGATPHYNFYTAKLSGGALVVTLTDGVDASQDPDTKEQVKEVARRTTTATSLEARGPASPALYGNCRVGSVQKGPDQPCMRQCSKGTECKGKDTCQMVTVKGTDGDHKVHACVPPK